VSHHVEHIVYLRIVEVLSTGVSVVAVDLQLISCEVHGHCAPRHCTLAL
jgi:hypothetical protein